MPYTIKSVYAVIVAASDGIQEVRASPFLECRDYHGTRSCFLLQTLDDRGKWVTYTATTSVIFGVSKRYVLDLCKACHESKQGYHRFGLKNNDSQKQRFSAYIFYFQY